MSTLKEVFNTNTTLKEFYYSEKFAQHIESTLSSDLQLAYDRLDRLNRWNM
ncbi:14003_t:CDS:2 [Cetraspora pellucida]|uniref:14003_t:CDS:1 n=1 Tax=Cetraspora pellucida TaxID=1433469 RepID=A0ACA9KVD8_9GLOM|nr:14003_t:CDS:2 [Cetraspora pellucida]